MHTRWLTASDGSVAVRSFVSPGKISFQEAMIFVEKFLEMERHLAETLSALDSAIEAGFDRWYRLVLAQVGNRVRPTKPAVPQPSTRTRRAQPHKRPLFCGPRVLLDSTSHRCIHINMLPIAHADSGTRLDDRHFWVGECQRVSAPPPGPRRRHGPMGPRAAWPPPRPASPRFPRGAIGVPTHARHLNHLGDMPVKHS